MNFRLGVIVLMLCASSAFGQTVAEFEAKYGKPMEVYSVSENIWMTPEFTTDGQVCKMRLYPKRINGATNYLSRRLPFAELTDVLNVLVPTNSRGKKNESFGATATGGPAAWTTYGYDKVTFTFISSFRALGNVESLPLKKGDFVFPNESQAAKGTESSAPSSDDFRYSQSSATEIVTIKWNDRKCGAN
jgi:hypothetical protein